MLGYSRRAGQMLVLVLALGVLALKAGVPVERVVPNVAASPASL